MGDIYLNHICEPRPRGALWYYHHLVDALQSEVAKIENDYGAQVPLPPEVLASYLAVVLADREQPPMVVHAPEELSTEQGEQLRQAWIAARSNQPNRSE